MPQKNSTTSDQVLFDYQTARDLIDRHSSIGGDFYSGDEFSKDNQYATAIFLNNKQQEIYNLFIQTARFSYISSVWERVMHLACGHDPSIETPHSFAGYDPKNGWLIMKPPRIPVPAHLSDNEAIDYEMALIQKIADSGLVSIKIGCQVYKEKIQGGVGVHAIVDAPAITEGVISDFIERFRNSESSWTEPERKTFRFEDIQDWHIACEEEEAWTP